MLTFKIPSGIEQVDRIWDGLYRGAAYLLVGRAQYGRNLLALHLARAGVQRGETCMFVSPRRPRELAIQAESLGFDLDEAIRAGRLRLLRVPSAVIDGADPHVVEDALGSLATFANEAAPERLIVEDFAPFLRTPDPRRVAATARAFIEHVCHDHTTAILGLGEPGNELTRASVVALRGICAGTMYLEREPEDDGTGTKRVVTMLPLVGSIHPRQQFPLDLADLVARTPAEFAIDSPSMGDGSGDIRDYSGQPIEPEPPQSNGDGAPPEMLEFRDHEVTSAPQNESDHATGDSSRQAGIRFFDVDGWPSTHESDGSSVQLDEREAIDSLPELADLGRDGAPTELAHTEFEEAYDLAREAWAEEDRGFLALAVRLDSRESVSADVPPLVTILRAVAGAEAVMTSDDDGDRLALLLPDAGADPAKALLGRLRQELFAAGPAIGEGVLSAVATLVLPNGEPFPTGEDFLAYVFAGE